MKLIKFLFHFILLILTGLAANDGAIDVANDLKFGIGVSRLGSGDLIPDWVIGDILFLEQIGDCIAVSMSPVTFKLMILELLWNVSISMHSSRESLWFGIFGGNTKGMIFDLGIVSTDLW